MKVVFCDRQRRHAPKHFQVYGRTQPNPEAPERIDALLGAVQALGHEVVEPDDHGPGPRAAVHTPEYLRFLSTIHERWRQLPRASEEVVPNCHPDSREAGYPHSPVGQAGYHMADTACPIGAGTWGAVCASANTAVHAAHLLLEHGGAAYALCRPPGHHAGPDQAGGFCYLNNCAIAAQYLRRVYERVAVLDVDMHHGNGTQTIFYRRADVFTVSLHVDPAGFYPFFRGYTQERGAGRGRGYNCNLLLPQGSGDELYLRTLERALLSLRSFQPHVLVVALGLDGYEGDPLAGLGLTTRGFWRIADAIASLGLPTVLVQEGGYLDEALGHNLAAFLKGFMGKPL